MWRIKGVDVEAPVASRFIALMLYMGGGRCQVSRWRWILRRLSHFIFYWFFGNHRRLYHSFCCTTTWETLISLVSDVCPPDRPWLCLVVRASIGYVFKIAIILEAMTEQSNVWIATAESKELRPKPILANHVVFTIHLVLTYRMWSESNNHRQCASFQCQFSTLSGWQWISW